MKRTFCLSFLLAACLLGQTDASLTVTSSRSINAQPDQTIVSVTLTTPLSTGLDQVLAALSGTFGLSAANLSSVYSTSFTTTNRGTQTTTEVLDWLFSLPVPISTVTTALNSLAALQKSVAQQNSGWSLTYSVQQAQVSAAAQAAAACSMADLLADARAQAQKLVAASPELSVGPILAISDGTGAANQGLGISGISFAFQGVSGIRFGSASVAALLIPQPYFFLTPTPSPNCTLVVKFALLRFQ